MENAPQQKYCADFLGARNCAWLDKTARFGRKRLLGISDGEGEQDDAAGVRPGRKRRFSTHIRLDCRPTGRLPATTRLRKLKLKSDGINGRVFAAFRRPPETGAECSYRDARKSSGRGGGKSPAARRRTVLKPSALVQSDAADIKKQAEKIVRPADSRKVRLEKSFPGFTETWRKKAVLSVANALRFLKMRGRRLQ
jgi:hypothetical protein